MNDLEHAYLAGFFDGEGCIYIHYNRARRNHQLRATVTQGGSNPVRVLQRFVVCFGGKLYPVKRQPSHRTQQWHWTATNSAAVVAVRALLPFLDVKREQAEIALDFIEKTQNPSRRPVSSEQMALREAYQLRLQEAKRDG